jgi:hypothetical protein
MAKKYCIYNKRQKMETKKAIQQNTHILFMPLLGSKNDQKELLLKGVIAVCNWRAWVIKYPYISLRPDAPAHDDDYLHGKRD